MDALLRTIIFLTVTTCVLASSNNFVTLKITNTTAECGETQTLDTESIVTIIAKGDLPSSSCTLTFNTSDANCNICYMFEKYAVLNTTLASINVTTTEPITIDSVSGFPTLHNCSGDSSMSITLTHDPGYQHDPAEPLYSFTLDVYNQCGYRGRAMSVLFEQVVQYAKGYQHGAAKADKERSTLLTGLGVGIVLSSVFLVVFVVSYCYVKNNPNRRASLTKI